MWFPDDIDIPAAKRAMDLRFDGLMLARNSIRDEEFVASHVALAEYGITHDELLVALYRALAPSAH